MARTPKSRPWFLRIFGTRISEPLDASRTDLVIVAIGFDDVEACSTTLARASAGEPPWRAEDEAVLRHHLELPVRALGEAERIAAQDGYRRGTGIPAPASTALAAAPEETEWMVLERVQILDALHCSQERSRMAGLAQRLGGRVAGWDALQPADPA